MPATITLWVDPDPSIGTRDGTSRATALASIASALTTMHTNHPNLVTADVTYVINCVGTSTTADAVSLAALPVPTMDDTHGVVIQTPLADRGANPWVWNTSRYKYSRTTAATAMILSPWSRNLIVRGLQIENLQGTSNDTNGLAAQAVTNGILVVEECLIRGNASSTATAGFGVNLSGGTNPALSAFRNNVLIGWRGTSGTRAAVRYTSGAGGSGAFLLYNNTFADCLIGVLQQNTPSTPVFKAVNNLFYDCTTAIDDANGAFDVVTDNATDLAALGAGTGRTSQTFTFEDAAGGDYRLTSGDAGARTFGADLSADSDSPFATDYAQNSRGSTWDIGAHQVTAGPPPIVADSLLFSTQPQNTVVGSTMAPIQVSAVDSTQSDAVDTDNTDNITLPDADSNYTGTKTKAAVAGVATFDDIVPLKILTGTTLTATHASFADEVSATFNTTAPSGGGVTIPLEAEPMATPVLKNAADPKKRRIYMNVWNDDGTPWSGSVSTVKPTLNGVTGTEDIVRVGGALHYAQPTQAESNTSEPVITAVLEESGSRIAAQGIGLVSESDFTAASVTTAALRDDAIALIAEMENDPAELRLKNSTNATVTIGVTRAARQAIATTTPPSP
jgi:hypothetical protein